MESNHKKRHGHGSSRSKGKRNANSSNHHLQTNFRIGSDADAESRIREGKERKVLFQIGSIASLEDYNDRLKKDTEAVGGTQISMASTSPSLSSTSSDDMIELKAIEETKSWMSHESNPQNRNLPNVSPQLEELHNTPRSLVSVATNASSRPPPLSPTQLPPVQVMNREGYDPHRIPSSIFEKSGALDWSAASNDSLFSLHIGDDNLARDHYVSPIGNRDISVSTVHDTTLAWDPEVHYSVSNVEELIKSGELLAYCPSLPIHLEDSEGKISDAEEQRSGEIETNMETDSEEKSSMPILSWMDLSGLNNSDQILSHSHISDEMPSSLHSFSSPLTKKSKKKSKTTTKNTKKKKKKCCLCCCFSCGDGCCCCRWPTCHGGFSCCRCPRCLSGSSCCKCSEWSCSGCFSCRCCCSCRWPKWSCCDCFSCRSCCSCHRCCCCCCRCCYSSSSLEIRHGEIGTEKNRGHRAKHRWFCCFSLCSWSYFCGSCCA